MSQSDWVGALPDPPPLRDIRNQRPSIAQEKAERLLVLGSVLRSIPESVRNGAIDTVRQWQAARAAAAKVAGSKRASVQEINSAINNMRRWS